MSRYVKNLFFGLTILAISFLIAACSGSSGTSGSASPTGVVRLDVTDAPSTEYAHVFVTVKAIAFHTDSSVGFSDYSSAKIAGWHLTTLSEPKTVDLVQLTNGKMYADLTGSSLFDGVTLPVGRYQQMRIFLASTEDALTASATTSGLTYNNEVQLNGDSSHYPLRVPSAECGIKVVPESPVVVTEGSSVSLALDFNLNSDVVEVSPNGTTEFMLKPRLGYFDMACVAAIKGAVSFGNLSTSRIVVKAEQVKTAGNGTAYRVVRRMTSVDRTSGAFNLYPLPVFGNATTAVYDVLIRGRNVETTIIKGITVHKGTNPDTAVDLGSITLNAGSEFTAQLGSSMHPSGAWINFYQSVGGDPVPFEIRDRHLDPYTGKFHQKIELSTGPIEVATYVPGGALVFTSYSSNHGQFSMVADAGGYDRGANCSGIRGNGGQNVNVAITTSNAPQASGTAGSISGIFDMALMGTGMGHGMGRGQHGMANPTSGQLFVVRDGMILDSVGALSSGTDMVGNAMHSGGGQGHQVTVDNLPSRVAGAVYNMYAIGWGNGAIEAGSSRGIDLRQNSTAQATIKMR